MTGETLRLLEEALAALEAPIRIALQCRQNDTAMLLKAAELDLKMKIYGISDHEFQAFCDALESPPRPNLSYESTVVDASAQFGKAKGKKVSTGRRK